MIKKLKIENFKCLKSESFDLKKLNVIAGVNCAGKSSVIQSALLFSDALQESETKLKKWKFETYRNKFQNADKFSISVNDIECVVKANGFELNDSRDSMSFQKNKDFFYLSENRHGPKNSEKIIQTNELGDRGEYVMGYYFKYKDSPINENLWVDDQSQTLSYNVNYWLAQIIYNGVASKEDDSFHDIGLTVQENDEESVKVTYDFGGLKNISPKNLGAGLSYLAKIVVVCLQANPGQVVIIENPELHLHPAAQAGMGHFLSFIASKGIQVIIETHCEHLINKIQYNVLKKMLNPDDVAIYYKKSFIDDFEELPLAANGHFKKDGKRIYFPEGFFDATLKELIEIG